MQTPYSAHYQPQRKWSDQVYVAPAPPRFVEYAEQIKQSPVYPCDQRAIVYPPGDWIKHLNLYTDTLTVMAPTPEPDIPFGWGQHRVIHQIE